MSEIVEIAPFADADDATCSFYERALGASPAPEWPGGAIFAVGALKLLVHERVAAMEGGPPNADHVAIGVADLDGAWSELLAAGFTGLVEPRECPWGRSPYARDPDGRLVELSAT